LVEVVTSIAIVGLLLALVVPALQAVRATSVKSICANNLHQIGLAIEQHVVRERFYPDGGTFIHDLLPGLEQTAVSDRIRQGSSTAAMWPNTIPRPRVDVLVCPSDNLGEVIPDSTSYGANMGSGPQVAGMNGFFATIDPTPGALATPGRLTRPADIVDGLSNTAAVGELLIVDPTLPSVDPRRVIWNVFPSLHAPSEFDQFRQSCLTPTSSGLAATGNFRGALWANSGMNYLVATYHHVLPPNSPSCLNSGISFGAFAAGSQHDGGAFTLYGDGRAAFTSNAIDLRVWSDLGSRQP
jgi:type II secretory pathway pseudopilin PulG